MHDDCVPFGRAVDELARGELGLRRVLTAPARVPLQRVPRQPGRQAACRDTPGRCSVSQTHGPRALAAVDVGCHRRTQCTSQGDFSGLLSETAMRGACLTVEGSWFSDDDWIYCEVPAAALTLLPRALLTFLIVRH